MCLSIGPAKCVGFRCSFILLLALRGVSIKTSLIVLSFGNINLSASSFVRCVDVMSPLVESVRASVLILGLARYAQRLGPSV